MKNYGFTGTRHGMTIDQHRSLARIMLCCHKTDNEEFKWHHGMCVGSDKQCHDLAKMFGFKTKGHPPNNPRLVAQFSDLDEIAVPLDYIDRNHMIVDESEHLVATPHEHNEIRRSGTWATIRYAKNKGIDVTVIYPDGRAEKR